MSFELFEFLDSKPYTLDGVSGHFNHVINPPSKAYPHWEQKLEHIPDEEGKVSPHYQAQKALMGDDWISDLTQDIDLFCQIATELGFDHKSTPMGSSYRILMNSTYGK